MKDLILFFLLVLSIATNAQDSLKQKANAEYDRLLIGINISPDYCNRILNSSSSGIFYSDFISTRDNIETYKIGYTYGINICYNISKKVGFEAGLQYSTKGYSTKELTFVFGDMIDPRFGFDYGPAPDSPVISTSQFKSLKFIYNYNYLDIPVRAIFNFGRNKIHFISSIGVTTNILINSTSTSDSKYEDGSIIRTTQKQPYDYKTFGLSPTFSLGADYKISNKIKLTAEPTIRYGLLNIINAPITANLWSVGFNVGCYYALN